MEKTSHLAQAEFVLSPTEDFWPCECPLHLAPFELMYSPTKLEGKAVQRLHILDYYFKYYSNVKLLSRSTSWIPVTHCSDLPTGSVGNCHWFVQDK